MSDTGNTVFTIGHSTHSIEAFFALLRQHGIAALADVRSSPYSRFNPQFNRENLQDSLKENGIRYVFLGKELGARSEDRSCYLNGRVQYGRLAQTPIFRSGLERVRQGTARFRIAMMCAEKEPLECHRTLLVAKALVESGDTVLHIHADGHLEAHEDAMTRLLKMQGLPETELFRTREELMAEALAKQEAKVAYVEEEHSTMSVREDSP